MLHIKRRKLVGLAFVFVTIILIALAGHIYYGEVSRALSMDLKSYNCVSDSMMRQLCQYPYTSSVTWALLSITLMWWPLIVIWMGLLGYLITTRHNDHADNPL